MQQLNTNKNQTTLACFRNSGLGMNGATFGSRPKVFQKISKKGSAMDSVMDTETQDENEPSDSQLALALMVVEVRMHLEGLMSKVFNSNV